jgi:hypothetical protein
MGNAFPAKTVGQFGVSREAKPSFGEILAFFLALFQAFPTGLQIRLVLKFAFFIRKNVNSLCSP